MLQTYDKALKDGGVITCCISAGQSEVYQEGVDYFNGQPVYTDIVAMGANVPVVEQSDYHYSCRSLIAAAIINVLQNGYSTEDALKEAEDQIKAGNRYSGSLFIPKGGYTLKSKSVTAKQERWGWLFLIPATLLICIMSFYPIIQAFLTSFKTGSSANMKWASPIIYNYSRMFSDKLFIRSVVNTFFYLIVQVPIMLILAILLAQLLNNRDLKFRGIFRTCVFLPCATALVSYSLIFKSLFATQGLINSILQALHITSQNINFLGTAGTAKMVIILALIWRWTGYNMVFYLAGLQGIEYSVYEAAKIDGANGWKTFWNITVPLLRPTIIMTFIMSINGTLQLFDESVNLTSGGPANSTITMSHYIYNNSFGQGVANFGYASAMSFFVFILVAILAIINLKVGDTRD